MKPCAVSWCCAMATHGDVCAVHRRYPDLHPDNLADDEELIDGGLLCVECNGSGKCSECKGRKEVTCVCLECEDEHERDCRECVDEHDEPTGECSECHGAGREYVRKKAEVA